MHIFLLYFSVGDVGEKGDGVMREDTEKNQPVLQSTDKDGKMKQEACSTGKWTYPRPPQTSQGDDEIS